MQPHKMTAEALCFDDILLVPQDSKVDSRKEVDLTMEFPKAKMHLPVISAPMDTVTEDSMAVAMAKNGGLGIVHRYMSLAEQCKAVYGAWEYEGLPIGAAVGAKGDYLERAEQLVTSGACVILVDTANGHSDYAVNAVKQLRSELGASVHIMAGNVSTRDAYVNLAIAGADSVRVGIGGGSVCTTRQVTGHGVPTLASIIDCYNAKKLYENMPGIIADGGIRTTGDMVKAFAAGADAVMVGSMLAGTTETPGEVVNGRKSYRGMASSAAQQDWRGFVGGAEGVATTTPSRGTVYDVLSDIRAGIQSGCSYSGVDRLGDLAERAKYVRVSGASLLETRPHAEDRL